jgi:ABC-type branched-subunit amino acid transport system ATPase component/ABC-type branched-subunit amino acid transport system permease subunit
MRKATYGLLAAAAVLWVFLAPSYWVFTATTAVLLAITTLGLTVVVGWVREVSLVQAGLVGTAMYVSGYLYRPEGGLGWPFLAAAAVGIGVVVVLSVLVSLSTARLSGVYILVLTLGLQITIERTIFANLKLTTGEGSAATLVTPRPALPGLSFASDRAFYLLCLALLGVVLVFLFRLRHSRFGRSLLLVGTDRQAAASVGISPWRSKIFAFALSGFLAGVAGVLTAPLFGTPPYPFAFFAFTSLAYLAIPVVAGFGSLLGVVLVAVFYGLAPQALEPLRISPLILAGFGVAAGTLAGRAGLSGIVQNLLRGHTIVLPKVTGGDRQQALEILEDYLPPPPEAGDALRAEHISLAFGGLQALDDVSITVPARHLVGLIGPNGAGKSTLFDVVNGLRMPDGGSVHLFGQPITGTNAWDRATLGLSRTFQSNRVSLELSVLDNLLAGAHQMIPGSLLGTVLGLPGARAGERRARRVAGAVAELLDIADVAEEPVGSLDFGSQRRVEIGRSLMSGPRVLLLDEPAAGLDSMEAAHLFALIRRLEADLGLTVLLVEHYVKAVLENCDLVYVLSEGRVIAAGSPDEIVAHPEVRAVYLGNVTETEEQAHVDA